MEVQCQQSLPLRVTSGQQPVCPSLTQPSHCTPNDNTISPYLRPDYQPQSGQTTLQDFPTNYTIAKVEICVKGKWEKVRLDDILYFKDRNLTDPDLKLLRSHLKLEEAVVYAKKIPQKEGSELVKEIIETSRSKETSSPNFFRKIWGVFTSSSAPEKKDVKEPEQINFDFTNEWGHVMGEGNTFVGEGGDKVKVGVGRQVFMIDGASKDYSRIAIPIQDYNFLMNKGLTNEHLETFADKEFTYQSVVKVAKMYPSISGDALSEKIIKNAPHYMKKSEKKNSSSLGDEKDLVEAPKKGIYTPEELFPHTDEHVPTFISNNVIQEFEYPKLDVDHYTYEAKGFEQVWDGKMIDLWASFENDINSSPLVWVKIHREDYRFLKDRGLTESHLKTFFR